MSCFGAVNSEFMVLIPFDLKRVLPNYCQIMVARLEGLTDRYKETSARERAPPALTIKA
jgi:hypothetical protein